MVARETASIMKKMIISSLRDIAITIMATKLRIKGGRRTVRGINFSKIIIKVKMDHITLCTVEIKTLAVKLWGRKEPRDVLALPFSL